MAEFETVKAAATPHERMTLMLLERVQLLEDRLEDERKRREASDPPADPPARKSKAAQRKRRSAGYHEPIYVADGVYKVYCPADGSWKWFSEDGA